MVVRDDKKIISARNAYSDDGGRTWRIGPAIASGTDESHAVELADGTIVENMRNGATRAVGRSKDGVHFGETGHDPVLVDAVCNAGIASMRDGRIVVFSNAASTKRENLTVRISYDGARTWRESHVLHAGPAAYSTVQPLRDGSIGVLYEAGEKSPYERITFARLPSPADRASRSR
jgi:sialidase-1